MPQTRGSPRIFYGWWIVASCFICATATGVVGYGFTAFFDSFVQEFGWSYAAISLGASLRGAETGLISPVLGFLVDRWGSKWVLLAGSILTGLGLIFLSQISSLAQFYGAWFVIAFGTSACGPAVVNPAITHWFTRNLGKATGILATGFAISGLLVPVIYKLIELYGWREALIILAIVCMAICIPLTFIIRNRPEPYNLFPDGIPLPSGSKVVDISNPKLSPSQIEINVGVRQALKSRTFWHLTIAFTFQSVVLIAVISHIMPYLKTVKIDGSTASFFAGAIPILSIAGRLGAGWISDRLGRKQVAVYSFILVLIGTLMFDYVRNTDIWVLVLAVILFSLSYGSALTLRAVLLREYFGKSKFASIFGILIGVQSFGAMMGPFLAGWTFDIWGAYHYAWLMFTAMNLAAVALLATTPRIVSKQMSDFSNSSGRAKLE
jgi:sugar phosphate permease